MSTHGDFEPTLGAAAPDIEAVLRWSEVTGAMMLFLGLRRMERRERLLT